MPETQSTPPGWFSDPLSGGLRWWDGRQWTDHRQPAAYAQSAPVSTGAQVPWFAEVQAAQAAHKRRTRWMALIAAVILVAGGIGWYFLAQNYTSPDWYQEGYDIGYRIPLVGSSVDGACDLALLGKIKLGDNPRLRRNRELRRGCVQGVLDHAREHKPLPTLK
ncbi:DUF2510 domain-containing protein [Mycolicibacterium fluoranthenivorans]|jgi:hypothetical protein|uniref:DUF2510 domain-containing protein n=1 Tax=Mycolicibacterium fluoranthenivorans TaxID=258505 RepID=A0A7G8PM43_9MYCO|nr:DUF2510 domain-containing protein [Mycolicibacterium fluoranthenivorans]QNJ95409.1 DUF2510 domain-containing protein [Mycolicibacterium fluoranthenivorans]